MTCECCDSAYVWSENYGKRMCLDCTIEYVPIFRTGAIANFYYAFTEQVDLSDIEEPNQGTASNATES